YLLTYDRMKQRCDELGIRGQLTLVNELVAEHGTTIEASLGRDQAQPQQGSKPVWSVEHVLEGAGLRPEGLEGDAKRDRQGAVMDDDRGDGRVVLDRVRHVERHRLLVDDGQFQRELVTEPDLLAEPRVRADQSFEAGILEQRTFVDDSNGHTRRQGRVVRLRRCEIRRADDGQDLVSGFVPESFDSLHCVGGIAQDFHVVKGLVATLSLEEPGLQLSHDLAGTFGQLVEFLPSYRHEAFEDLIRWLRPVSQPRTSRDRGDETAFGE